MAGLARESSRHSFRPLGAVRELSPPVGRHVKNSIAPGRFAPAVRPGVPAERGPKARPKRSGLTLIEVVVVAATTALGVAVLLPALAAARTESLAARCGANLKRIGQAYSLWAGDHNGFMPPRCRADAGCHLWQVPVGFIGFAQPRKENLPYGETPNDGLSIVGQPPLSSFSPTGVYGHPDAVYRRTNDFSLNRYVIPNWQVGRRMRAAHCPADTDTLLAPDDGVYGIPQGAVASTFQLHGTSYGTNIEQSMPSRGHGAWAMPVENVVNLRAGPNYNPEVIYKPARYIAAADLGIFYWDWRMLVADDIGGISGVGAWHETAPPPTGPPVLCSPPPWPHGNALFGDLHVQFGEYDIPSIGIALAGLCDYVTAGWSLYPYKRRAVDVQSAANCCN